MSQLRGALEEYIAVRRSLGYKMEQPYRILLGFVAFAERKGDEHITTDLVLRWIGQPSKAQQKTWAGRLSMVRVFARWWSATDPLTQIPPPALLPRTIRRTRPHMYSDEDIPHILVEASKLRARKGLRGSLFVTFFGLIAATGLRMSEAIALDREDVDLEDALLTIRQTKFRKDRLVPIHSTTCQALAKYITERDRIIPRPDTPAFFVAESSQRVTEHAARYAFARISQRIGLRAPVPRYGLGKGPRIHDLRHRFAIKTILDWYRKGLDVDKEMPKLSTYLGHLSVAGTYWYIEAVPELLLLATERLQNRSQEACER